jgi:hypothetical protein
VDTPRKRTDKFKVNNSCYNKLSIGSPVVGRRGIVVNTHGPRHQSCHTTPMQSPCPSPVVTGGREFTRADSLSQQENDNVSIGSNNSTNLNQQIRSRINSFKISMFNNAPRGSNNKRNIRILYKVREIRNVTHSFRRGKLNFFTTVFSVFHNPFFSGWVSLFGNFCENRSKNKNYQLDLA